MPRRIAWRVMIPKKTSTRFSQEPEVGVKCRVIRGLLGQPGLDVGVLVGGVVVHHDVQLAARVGLGDLLEEAQELVVAVPRVAGVGDLAGRDLQGGEQGGGAVPLVVVGGLLGQARAASAGSARSGPAPGSGTSRRRTARSPSPAGPGTGRRRRGPWPPARGSVENLNVSRRHGCTPQSRQIRATVALRDPELLCPAAGSTSA